MTRIAEELEIYLFRTIPRPSLSNNIKVRVKRVAHDLEAFSHQQFPAGSLFPVKLRMLTDEPQKRVKDLPIMGFFAPVESRDFTYSYFPGSYEECCSCAAECYLCIEAHGVGFRWRSTWSEADYLGKRDSSSTADQPIRQHEVAFSRFGTEIPVEPSKELHQCMQEHLEAIEELSALTKDRGFEIQFDEITCIWEIKMYPVTEEEDPFEIALMEDDKLLTYSDPHQAVHTELSRRLLRNSWSSNCEFIKIVNLIMDSVWASLNSNSPGWVAGSPPKPGKAAFIGILKLKKWAEAIYELFYHPLVQILYPELLGGPPKAIPDLDKLPIKLPTVLQTGIRFFQRVRRISKDASLLLRQTHFEELKTQWTSLSTLFANAFNFKMSSIKSVPSVWRELKQHLQWVVRYSATRKGEPRLKPYNPSETPAKSDMRNKLFACLGRLKRFYQHPESLSNLVAGKAFDTVFVKTLNGENFFSNLPTASNSEKLPPLDMQQIIFAGLHENTVIVMSEENEKGFKTGKLCVLHHTGIAKCFEIGKSNDGTAQEDAYGPIIASFWDCGRLLMFRKFGESGSVCLCFDFKGINKVPVTALRANCFEMANFEFDPAIEKYKSLGYKMCTFVNNAFYWFMTGKNQTPNLWSFKVTDEAVHKPTQCDWAKHFSPKELKRLADPRKKYRPDFAIVGSSSSKRLYFTILQLVKPPRGEPISEQEFTIAYFKQSRDCQTLDLFTKKAFRIGTNLIRPENVEILEYFTIRMLKIRKHQFLLLQFVHGPTFAFGIQNKQWKWLMINRAWGSSLPKLPGNELVTQGFHSSMAPQYSYAWRSFLAAEKRSLDVYYRHFSY